MPTLCIESLPVHCLEISNSHFMQDFSWRSCYGFSLSLLFSHPFVPSILLNLARRYPLPHELRELSCTVQILGPSWFLLWVCLGPAITERRELIYIFNFLILWGTVCGFVFALFSSVLYVQITYHVPILQYMEARIQPSQSTLQTLSVF